MYPPTGALLDEFQVHWTIKIDGEVKLSKVTNFSKEEVKDKLVDIILEDEIPVKKQKPITILVRYTTLDDSFMAQAWLGYGGENYKRVPENMEKDAFTIQECP